MNLDLKAAYEQSIVFAKSHADISIEMLRKLSSIVMKNTGTTYHTVLGDFSSADGDLRLLNVTAGMGGRSYNYSKVPAKLAELCESINNRRKTLSKTNIIECYKLSFDAHFHLVTIHPWADGNGRMSRLLMNQLQFEFGIIPTNINKDRKAAYIEALVATRENDDLELFRHFMFDEHIRNLEQMIHNYRVSIEDEGTSLCPDVGINVDTNERLALELIRANNRITAKEVSASLSVSLRQGERIMAALREKGLIRRVGSNKSGHWEIRE